MSLLSLQRDFRAHLTDAPVVMAPWGAADSGLGIYHNAYRVQLIDCLAETYPQLHAWLGGESFIDAVRAHIERHPPHGWTLGVYGDGLDRTLAALYPDDPEVAELATLEWELARAFTGEDAAALPTGMIASVDWERAGLRFVPTVHMMPARTNAGAIWSALSAATPPPAAEMLPEPGAMLVWRQDFTPCFRTIETIEHGALTLMATGTSFADLCVMLIDARGEDDGLALAGAMLAGWFADGLIADVVI